LLASNGNMDWLRNHDFGNSFPFNCVGGIHSVSNEWRGAQYEFEDLKLRAAWNSTRAAINELSALLVAKCGPQPNNPSIATVRTQEDINQGACSPRTLAATKELNAAANCVVQRWDAVVRLAIARLSISAV